MILGLNGYPGVGKDTVGRLLSHHGWKPIAMADPIRDLLLHINPQICTDIMLQSLVDRMGWDSAKRAFPVIREHMQAIGSWMRANVYEDIFISLCFAKISDLKAESYSRFVVTDVRLQNEVDWINANDGIVIRLHRDGIGPFNNHESEQIPQGLATTIDATHQTPTETAIEIMEYMNNFNHTNPM